MRARFFARAPVLRTEVPDGSLWGGPDTEFSSCCACIAVPTCSRSISGSPPAKGLVAFRAMPHQATTSSTPDFRHAFVGCVFRSMQMLARKGSMNRPTSPSCRGPRATLVAESRSPGVPFARDLTLQEGGASSTAWPLLHLVSGRIIPSSPSITRPPTRDPDYNWNKAFCVCTFGYNSDFSASSSLPSSTYLHVPHVQFLLRTEVH